MSILDPKKLGYFANWSEFFANFIRIARVIIFYSTRMKILLDVKINISVTLFITAFLEMDFTWMFSLDDGKLKLSKLR